MNVLPNTFTSIVLLGNFGRLEGIVYFRQLRGLDICFVDPELQQHWRQQEKVAFAWDRGGARNHGAVAEPQTLEVAARVASQCDAVTICVRSLWS